MQAPMEKYRQLTRYILRSRPDTVVVYNLQGTNWRMAKYAYDNGEAGTNDSLR